MTKMVLVETLGAYRHRYAVECDDPEEAARMVRDCEVEEFAQRHVGEMVMDTKVIDEDEYLRLFDADNDYISDWPPEKKLEWVHKGKDST